MSVLPYPIYKDSGSVRLGPVPKHWNIRSIKQTAPFNYGDAVPSGSRDETGTIPLAGSNGTFGWHSATNSAGPCIVIGRKGSFGQVNWFDGPAYVTDTAFFVNSADLKLRWYFWVLIASDLSSVSQDTGVPGLSRADAHNTLLAEPSFAEQDAIATFLDHETAKIDALIAEQERLVVLLAEKRKAVISRAVTQGLDPSVPMKASGVEWLADVPKHWNIIGLGKITSDKCDGPFGSGLKSEHYTDAGVRVVRLQNIRAEGFNGADAAYIAHAYYAESLSNHDVRTGDLLIAGLGDDRHTVGRACVAPEDIEPAMVKADCFRFRLKPGTAIADFVAFQLTSGSVFDAGILSSGSTRSRIPLSVMSKRKVALPQLEEQQQIISYLQRQTSILDCLVSESERAIYLLKERRAALISAAVTGKIDVRGFVPAEQEAA